MVLCWILCISKHITIGNILDKAVLACCKSILNVNIQAALVTVPFT